MKKFLLTMICLMGIVCIGGCKVEEDVQTVNSEENGGLNNISHGNTPFAIWNLTEVDFEITFIPEDSYNFYKNEPYAVNVKRMEKKYFDLPFKIANNYTYMNLTPLNSDLESKTFAIMDSFRIISNPNGGFFTAGW